jgi:site-specific DNA recombinase
LLRGLSFPKEILEWIVTALRESHTDEKAFHDAAISRLQAEYRRLQNRIDVMYLDKLDGRIETAFFDSKSAEWRAEQDRLLRDVATHPAANQTYIEEGVRLLHLAQRAHELFERQEAGENGDS